MITNFKIFESEKQYREVDLQQLWNDLEKYYSDLFFGKIMFIDSYFDSLLNKMLDNKDIEFKRVENVIDGEIIYGLSGKVKSIEFKNDNNWNIRHVIATMYGDMRYLISIIYISGRNKKPSIIKIYNSEPLEIEKKIQELKTIDKYNL